EPERFEPDPPTVRRGPSSAETAATVTAAAASEEPPAETVISRERPASDTFDSPRPHAFDAPLHAETPYQEPLTERISEPLVLHPPEPRSAADATVFAHSLNKPSTGSGWRVAAFAAVVA